MANLVEIIIGTYEEFLLGYKVENLRSGNKPALTQSFSTRSHTASVRCVAVNQTYLASGGADDRVLIYDMKARKEVQVLMHHEGTVNAVAITPDGSHLLTGSDDGKMTAIRMGSWITEAVWKKAHAGSPVTHISCHPSGKLALTLGNDLTLRTWNLVKGRLAYTTNLKNKTMLGRNPDCISWSPDGDHFTITGMRVLEIWNIKTAGVIKEINCESKPISLCWLNAEKVIVGLEDGNLMIVDIESDDKPELHEAHKQRVKGVAFVNEILATASSSGEICLWTVDLEENTIAKLTSTNIGCRPTCIALLDLTQFDDDYLLKLETKEAEQEIVAQKPKLNPKNKIRSVGNVIVEIEEDKLSSDDENFVAIEKKLGKAQKGSKSAVSSKSNDEPVSQKKNKKRKKETRLSNGFQEESCSEGETIGEKSAQKERKGLKNKANRSTIDTELPKKKKKIKRKSV